MPINPFVIGNGSKDAVERTDPQCLVCWNGHAVRRRFLRLQDDMAADLVDLNVSPPAAECGYKIVPAQVVAVEGLQNLEIGAGQRLAMRLGDHLSRGDLMVTVDADGPIVVERDLYRVGGPGISASLGIPSL